MAQHPVGIQIEMHLLKHICWVLLDQEPYGEAEWRRAGSEEKCTGQRNGMWMESWMKKEDRR